MRRLSSIPRDVRSEIRIGTSGWSYDAWRGPLYPAKLPKKNWLRYYATQFSSAEINSSFYRTPTLAAVKSWSEDTPSDFKFSWKASKFMTHWKRLLPTCENSIALMQTRLRVLGPKAGVVLFQLPRHFHKDTGRLREFLHMLPRRYRYSFEFRDAAWYASDVLGLLHKFDVALCISDHADAPAPWETTARHVYIRGHGPSGRYHGNYPVRTLARWAEAILTWESNGGMFSCTSTTTKKPLRRVTRESFSRRSPGDAWRARAIHFCLVTGALGFTDRSFPERLAATASIKVFAASLTSS